jgi:hypothetical protein
MSLTIACSAFIRKGSDVDEVTLHPDLVLACDGIDQLNGIIDRTTLLTKAGPSAIL